MAGARPGKSHQYFPILLIVLSVLFSGIKTSKTRKTVKTCKCTRPSGHSLRSDALPRKYILCILYESHTMVETVALHWAKHPSPYCHTPPAMCPNYPTKSASTLPSPTPSSPLLCRPTTAWPPGPRTSSLAPDDLSLRLRRSISCNPGYVPAAPGSSYFTAEQHYFSRLNSCFALANLSQPSSAAVFRAAKRSSAKATSTSSVPEERGGVWSGHGHGEGRLVVVLECEETREEEGVGLELGLDRVDDLLGRKVGI